MSSLLIGILGALIAGNPPVTAASNVVTQTNATVVAAPGTNDPVEVEYQRLMAQDDAAAAEVDGWIRENQQFEAKGAGIPKAELNQRIRTRFEPVCQAYEVFIKKHPNHAKARVAYASFLNDLGDEDGEMTQLEKARELDPKDPAVWNNLANHYGHDGPITNAFIYYAKAIALNPTESVYYQNFGTTVFLFRKDAKEFFHINEQQVFDKAMLLYSNAMKCDPTNFALATDVAQSYYIIKPMRTNDALMSWTNTLKLAQNEIEREGVYLHLARIKMSIGRLEEARAQLDAVTNLQLYGELKQRLLRNLARKENEMKGTNNPPTVSVSLESNAPPMAPEKK